MLRRIALAVTVAVAGALGTVPAAAAAPDAECHFHFQPSPDSPAGTLVMTGFVTSTAAPLPDAIRLRCTMRATSGAEYYAEGTAPGPAVAVANAYFGVPLTWFTICIQVTEYYGGNATVYPQSCSSAN